MSGNNLGGQWSGVMMWCGVSGVVSVVWCQWCGVSGVV